MLNNLYDNIGTKIKNWAIWVFVIEAITAIIGGIVLLIEEAFLAGIASIILGPLAAWVSSWLLYGFGELIDSTCALDYKLSIIVQPILDENLRIKREKDEKRKQEAIEYAKQVTAARAEQAAADRAKREAEEQARQEALKRAQQEAEAYAKQLEQGKAKPVLQKESKLADKLAFALHYGTDEGMINYLQRIDNEEVAEILTQPSHLIRGLITQLLEKQ